MIQSFMLLLVSGTCVEMGEEGVMGRLGGLKYGDLKSVIQS